MTKGETRKWKIDELRLRTPPAFGLAIARSDS